MKIEHIDFRNYSGSRISIPANFDYSQEHVSVLDCAKYIRGVFPLVCASACAYLDNSRVLSVTSQAFTVVYSQRFPDDGCPIIECISTYD